MWRPDAGASGELTCGGHRSALLLAAFVSGCAVGPKYVRPTTAPIPAAYKEAPPGSDVLQPAQPKDAVVHRAWWEDFGDARLDDLEAQLLRSNPGLAEAEARFRQAQSLIKQNRAAYLPTVTVATSAERVRTGGGRSTRLSWHPAAARRNTTSPAACRGSPISGAAFDGPWKRASRRRRRPPPMSRRRVSV